MSPTSDPLRAVIYTRVSRDDTGEGRSNDRQEAECRKLCEYKGWHEVAVERDVSISAYSGKVRAGWMRVLDLVRSGSVDVVVAWHIDRMTRSMLDLEELIVLSEEKGVAIATVSGDIDLTSDMGRMVARILAAVARAEVERKSARQKLANEQRASEGRPHVSGVRPFGYADDHLTIVESEADAIREGARRALQGDSMGSIARHWEELGLKSSRAKGDKGWSARGVGAVLQNPRYAGIRVYNGRQLGAAQWEPILDLDTHLRLVEKLSDPNRKKGANAGRSGRKAQSLLTGIAVCSRCGKTVRGSSSRRLLTYSCPSSHIHTDREAVDQLVQEAVVAQLEGPDAAARFAPMANDGSASALAEIEKQRERLTTFARLLARGAMTEEQFEVASLESRQLLEAGEALLSASANSALSGLVLGSKDVRQQWHALSLNRKRLVIQSLYLVTLRPRGRWGTDLAIEEQVELSDIIA